MLSKMNRDDIERFARKRNVKRVAVENFLMTVHNNGTISVALANLKMDTGLYKWNHETVDAIRGGIYVSAGTAG